MSAGRTNAAVSGGGEMVQGALSYDRISWPEIFYIDDSGWKRGYGTSVTSISPLKNSFVLFAVSPITKSITGTVTGGAEIVRSPYSGYFLIFVTGDFSASISG